MKPISSHQLQQNFEGEMRVLNWVQPHDVFYRIALPLHVSEARNSQVNCINVAGLIPNHVRSPSHLVFFFGCRGWGRLEGRSELNCGNLGEGSGEEIFHETLIWSIDL